CASSGTITGSSPAIWAKIGYPSNVGDVITIFSPGLVTACSTCRMTPVAPTQRRAQPPRQVHGRAVGGKDGLDQGRAHRRKRRKRILVEREGQWVERTGQRLDGLGQLSVERGHQSRPPHLTAAAPAKSPACANAAIITTSPALS